MRRVRVMLLGILVACSVAAVAALASGPRDDEGIAWETDLVAARAKAAESGRPLLVAFR